MADKVTVPEIKKMKESGEKIAVLTAYEYSFARIFDQAGVEILLVGDSLGAVFQGEKSTLPVTLEHMIYHTKAVARACPRALIVADMPFLTFQISPEEAKRNAGRLLQEAGAEAVKLEGGVSMAETIAGIVTMGIPVMGHVGLTPQSIHRLGGYRVQGKEKDQREAILRDALAVQEAGAFSVVLEAIPEKLAQEITASLAIPTIGIGAGIHCDGQVLVMHDMLGLFDAFTPKFVKRYANLKCVAAEAVRTFVAEVKEAKFPDDKHSFH